MELQIFTKTMEWLPEYIQVNMLILYELKHKLQFHYQYPNSNVTTSVIYTIYTAWSTSNKTNVMKLATIFLIIAIHEMYFW